MNDPVITRNGPMAAPRAYQFDEVFAIEVDESGRPQPNDRDAGHEAAQAARQEGYARGLEDGRRAAAEDGAAQLAESVAQLAQGVQATTEAAAAERRRIEAEAVRLGLAAARKLAPALIAREPMAELEALLRDCLGELRDAPHLVIRVCPDHVDELRQRLEAADRETGFSGRIAVLADPDIGPGDGRIDWADGGIVRCRAAIDEALDQAVNRYLAAAETVAGDEDGDNG